MKQLLLFLVILISLSVEAQNASLTGKVTNEKHEGLPFVSVQVKNTLKATTTDADGNYYIENFIPGSYAVEFASMGYYSQSSEISLEVSENRILNVQLIEEAQDLGEVMITTNRRIETLGEVPSSISVISTQKIENLIQTSNSVADILIEVPGMALSTNQTSSTGQTLRGRNMLVLIDGIPQSTPLRSGGRDINTIDPNTIQRVEVIKGATAIYGNGADGGIVNYITKDPAKYKAFESTTQITAEGSLVETDHTIGSRISQTFSGTKGDLGYVVNGNFRQTGIFRDADGEIISPTYGLGETDQYSLFGKLSYDLDQKNSVALMYNYFSSNQNTEYVSQDGVYGVRPAIGVLGEVLGVDQGNRHNHNAQLTFLSKELIGDTDFRLNLYMQDFLTVYGFDGYFFNSEAGYEGGQSTVESDKKGLRFNFSTPYVIGDVSGDVLYGMDILNDQTAQKLIDGRVWAPEMNMSNFAPYLQLKTLYKDFVLKAGMRFENINIKVPDYQTIHIFPYGGEVSNGGVAVNGGELKYDATTFNAGLRYNRFKIFKPFISFSQSFSIADLGRTLRTATENTVSQISSEAVIANNYEVGFNSQIGRTSLNGAYFISTSDLGATYREVNGIFQIARQPEKVYGFELALDSEIADNLYFGSSISYTEGKLDSEDNGNYNTYMNGDRIPPVKAVTYLQYRIWNKWDARISHIYSGNRKKFEPSSTGTYTYGKGPVESFNLFSFSSSYQVSPSTKVGLGIENLLNEDYYNLLSQWSARNSNYIKGNGARFNLSLTVKI